MTTSLDAKTVETIQQYDADRRFSYLIKEVVAHRAIWILKDEHGCVMLTTDDEDGVPVWPHKEFADAWATGEWAHCVAESIDLNTWRNRWTSGLEEDQLVIVAFPNQNEEGIVVFPDEFDFELSKSIKKSSSTANAPKRQ